MKPWTKLSSIGVFLILLFVSVNFKQDVFICTGKYAKRYHYTDDCRGLSNCKGEIKKVDIEEARRMGRTLCGWED